LAIKHLLEKIGHQVTSIAPNEFPVFLKYLDEEQKNIITFENDEDKVKLTFNEAEVIFVLDFNKLNRAGEEIEKLINNSDAVKVMIDHHLEPDDFADFKFHNVNASSTAELVYQFIDELNFEQHLTKNVADAIYMGILTDTGRFSYNVNANVHKIVSILMEKGADINKASEAIFNSNSLSRMRFWGFCLSRKMKVYKKLPVATMPLNKEDLYKYNVQKGDTEGLVNEPLSIKGVKLSILLKEENDKVKLSLRSTGDFSVNEMAKKYFNGGGHKNAAGGILLTTIDKAIETVHQAILDNTDLLLQEKNKK